MNVRNSVIAITGGAIRVGRAHARYLASLGAHISFTYVPGEPWHESVQDIESFGVRCMAYAVDGRDLVAVREWVDDTFHTLGSVDVLINNASPFIKRPFLELSEDEWDLSIGINVKMAFFAAQAAARHMIAKGSGVILNISDMSAFMVSHGYAHHAIGKSGLVQLARYIASELGPAIRSNALVLGPILPPQSYTAAQIAGVAESTMTKRWSSPEDVTRMLVFLIEHEYLTGQTYFVDGGQQYAPFPYQNF